MIYSKYRSVEDPLSHPVVTKQDRFWKRILIVDDNEDITLAFKLGIEAIAILTKELKYTSQIIL